MLYGLQASGKVKSGGEPTIKPYQAVGTHSFGLAYLSADKLAVKPFHSGHFSDLTEAASVADEFNRCSVLVVFMNNESDGDRDDKVSPQNITLRLRPADEISNLTSRFRLGLGAFVDKPTAPYMDTDPVMVAAPDPNNVNSTPTFGYHNVLPLNKNTSHFQEAIEKLMASGNVDNPEGGLEALVQVAACEKLGGVVIPNDGLCHLDGQEYTASLTMDYPSPGLVRDLLLESQVVPIFAVASKEKQVYEQLAYFLGNETYAETGELLEDSSNIVRVIGEAYKKIARTVTIRDSNSAGLTLRYTALCPKGEIYEDTRTCTGVELGDTVSFKVTVSMANCTDDLPTNFSIKTPYGQVSLKLSYVCSCDCEAEENLDPTGLIYGETCECNNLNCPKDPENEEICGGSERGVCDCGQCKCKENWSGPSCSCSKDLNGCTKDGSCIGNCEANRPCVQCQIFGTGELVGEDCKTKCKDFRITVVDKLTSEMGKQCRFRDEDDCYFGFAYTIRADGQLEIYTQRTKDCPSEMQALLVILGVIGAVLAVALALLLIWRVLATIQDRRAFAKFEKEQQNAKCVMAENPIFKPTTTTFMNPMYGVKT
ncbi:Integrin beta-1 [Stylophora pistillata]|uniref:Integrin beta-1 n=1 Tax=Stylophora pistillata TaxID=50429 RepID=A0A2B4SHM6_STYPI|nr:Integrin beta-1 [Stylophora pistillata]